MKREVHEYFHKLMWIVEKTIEPKFAKGDKEHGPRGMLWDMPDDVLLKNFNEELMDAIVYWAEIQRRKNPQSDKATITSSKTATHSE